MLSKKTTELADIMKLLKFRKELTLFIQIQLIKGGKEHYVVVCGQDYTLQVKYKKGSMITFDILGYQILLYEVPYICVPTLLDSDMVKDGEMTKILENPEASALRGADDIKIKTTQQ